jgi:preprotein translocase subunit SecD
MPKWLLILLILCIGFVVLSVGSFLAMPVLLDWIPSSIGTVLVYEMDGVKPSDDCATLAKSVMSEINIRLCSSGRSFGKAKVVEGNRIEVDVYGNNPNFVQMVKERIELQGSFEFRILANSTKHKAQIEIAEKEKDKSIYYNSKGEWIARWVVLKKGEIVSPNNITRTRKTENGSVTEVLVVSDFYNVSKNHIDCVLPSIDDTGRPCVNFTLNPRGAKLFKMLTEDNQPDINLHKCELGIIFNDVVQTAPSINAVISKHGQITGNFTHWEVEHIISCLNARPLPVKLKRIEERVVE